MKIKLVITLILIIFVSSLTILETEESCVSVIDSWDTIIHIESPTAQTWRRFISHGEVVADVLRSLGVEVQEVRLHSTDKKEDFQKALDSARCPIVNISMDSRKMLNGAIMYDIVFPSEKKYFISLGNYTDVHSQTVNTPFGNIDYRRVNGMNVTLVRAKTLIRCGDPVSAHSCITRDGNHRYRGKAYYGSSYAAPKAAASAAKYGIWFHVVDFFID